MKSYFLSPKVLTQDNEINRIVVVDSSPLVPFAISKLLANYPYMNVLGQSNDGMNALTLCRRLAPDLVIIDPYLPSLDGRNVIRQLKRNFDDLRVLVYTNERENLAIEEYLHLDVEGLVLKNSSLSMLLNAIHSLGLGKKFLDHAFRPNQTHSPFLAKKSTVESSIAMPQLSNREKQVLKLISEGAKNKQIAAHFTISVKTVESHRLNLMRKLDAHSVVDLVKWAHRLNLAA